MRGEERRGEARTGEDRRAQERTGQERRGEEKGGEERMGQFSARLLNTNPSQPEGPPTCTVMSWKPPPGIRIRFR